MDMDERALQHRQLASDEFITWNNTQGVTYDLCATVPFSWSTGGHDNAPYAVNASFLPDAGPPWVSWQVSTDIRTNYLDWRAELPGPGQLRVSVAATTYSPDNYPRFMSETLQLAISNETAAGQQGRCTQSAAYDTAAQLARDYVATPAPTETQWFYDTVDSEQLKRMAQGAAGAAGVLAIALVAVSFFYYRLHRQMKRLKRSQASLGRWVDSHNPGSGKVRQDDASNVSRESKEPPCSSPTLVNSDSARSKLLPFLSRTSTNRSTTNTNTDSDHSHLWSRPVSSISQSLSSAPASTSSGDPFADREVLALESRSASRASHAETVTSEAYTATSGRLSSIAPSTVGPYSFVSDEHYSRQKASTISPVSAGGSSGGRANASLLKS